MKYREYLLSGLPIIMLLVRTLFHVSQKEVRSEIRKLNFCIVLSWANFFPVIYLSSDICNLNCFFGINPLNPELIPICYLLALLGAHHFLHVSRIRVKLLTFRRLMSYIWSTYS